LNSEVENMDQHRTPWSIQVVGAVFALLAGGSAVALFQVRFLDIPKNGSISISAVGLAICILFSLPYFIRERREKHTKFAELNSIEKFSLLLGFAIAASLFLSFGLLWVRS